MLSKMNASVDRCSDFYSYACDSFINDVTIPPSQPMYSTLSGSIESRRVARMRKVSVNIFCRFLHIVNLLNVQGCAEYMF